MTDQIILKTIQIKNPNSTKTCTCIEQFYGELGISIILRLMFYQGIAYYLILTYSILACNQTNFINYCEDFAEKATLNKESKILEDNDSSI